jgi:hypothetical protein
MRNPVSVTLVGLLGALVIAAAAGLLVNGGVLQAGGEHDLSCDEDGVTVQFDKDDSSGLIAGAKIEGIDADCFGASLKFDTSAPDEGGPFFVGSIAAPSYSFHFSSLQEESDVGNFDVVIFGPDSELPNQGD